MAESSEISLWREVLKSELLASEQRQREYFDSRLELKASKEHVDKLETWQAKQERGEFTPAQTLRFKNVVEEVLATKLKSTWALRANKAAWFYTFVAIAALALSAYAVILQHKG